MRKLLFTAAFAASMLLAGCAATGPVRDDAIVCYSGGVKVFEGVGTITRLGDGEYDLTRANGSNAILSGGCVVELSAAAPVQTTGETD